MGAYRDGEGWGGGGATCPFSFLCLLSSSSQLRLYGQDKIEKGNSGDESGGGKEEGGMKQRRALFHAEPFPLLVD